MTSLVSLARMPSLFSFLPALIPGVPCSRTKAEIPRCPFDRSEIAITTMTPPILPWVMKVFEPFNSHLPSACFTATVRMPAASLPALASVKPQAPSTSPVTRRGRYRCFCASLPNIAMCDVQSPLCAATDNPIAGQTRESSSMQMQ